MVEDYKVRTLNDSYESYTSPSSGFAITDEIEFQCSGLNPLQTIPFDSRRTEFAYTEYAHSRITSYNVCYTKLLRALIVLSICDLSLVYPIGI